MIVFQLLIQTSKAIQTNTPDTVYIFYLIPKRNFFTRLRVVERVAQYLVSIQIKSSGVYMRLMCDQMETDFGDKE